MEYFCTVVLTLLLNYETIVPDVCGHAESCPQVPLSFVSAACLCLTCLCHMSPSHLLGGHPVWRGWRPAPRQICDSCCSTSFPEASGRKQQLLVSCRICQQCRKLSQTSQGPTAVSPARRSGRTDNKEMWCGAPVHPVIVLQIKAFCHRLNRFLVNVDLTL